MIIKTQQRFKSKRYTFTEEINKVDIGLSYYKRMKSIYMTEHMLDE